MKEVIKLYVEEKLSTRAVAERLGISRNKVMSILKESGLTRSKSEANTKEVPVTKNQLVELYVNQGLSTREVAVKINRSQSYVRVMLDRYSIPTRESGIAQALKRGVQFNEKFFDEWSEEMAYVLGFIYADGSITDNRLTVVLQRRDRPHLELIADLLDFPKDRVMNTMSSNGYECVRLAFSRKYTAGRLKELGVVPNKTATLAMPNIPKEYVRHFIRGYFDGDGTVSKSGNRIYVGFTCGSKEFADTLVDILSPFNPSLVLDKRGKGNYYVNIHSKQGIKGFYDYLYKDSSPCMLRKKDKMYDWLCQSCAFSDRECND